MIKNTEKRAIHIYTFYNSRIHLCVKATDLADAIEWLKIIFGESWVKYNLDSLEISWYKPNHKFKND